MKQEIKKVENKIENIDKEKRRNNIVIHGLKIEMKDQENMEGKVEDFMESTLQVKVNTKAVIKLSDVTYLVELTKPTDKMKIMKNKNKLKNISPKIFINDDMNRIEREIQGKIRKQAKDEKEKGNKVKIGFQKLLVDDEVWRWDKDKNEFKKGDQKN